MHDEIKSMFDLTGKTGIIIGGAKNLGYDMSCILAAAGCNLCITSRDYSTAQDAARKVVNRYKVQVKPFQLDHVVAEEVAEVVDQAWAWNEGIDILINNAGGGSGKLPSRLFEKPPEKIKTLIEKNLLGTLFSCKAVGKLMAGKKCGKIINIASIAGILGRDRRMYDQSNMAGQAVDYAAAKAGVIGMTKDLAAYLSPMGINVNCISPGGFHRPDLPESFVKDYSARTPLGRMGRDGTDIKGAVLFLASSGSDYITGHNLVVDGGFTIWQ